MGSCKRHKERDSKAMHSAPVMMRMMHACVYSCVRVCVCVRECVCTVRLCKKSRYYARYDDLPRGRWRDLPHALHESLLHGKGNVLATDRVEVGLEAIGGRGWCGW